MRRCWIGLALLLVLLAGAALVTWSMARIHEPIADALESASRLALDGDLAQARALAAEAAQDWAQGTAFRGCFADHAPMEEADGGFAELAVYADAGETAEFAAACARLSRQVAAMAQAHSLRVWNFF